jgi:tetratricopeptide (TPR) repeat protein
VEHTSRHETDLKGVVAAKASAVFAVLRLFALACLVAWPVTLRAETLDATLVATQEEGYGRLVLTFADLTLLPQYDALASNGVLRIRFQDAVRVDVDTIPIDMPSYVSIARRDPDGSAIRFALMGDFKVNTMEAGEKLFIDLLPPTWQGMPPGLPDDVVRELARRAEEAIRRARALEQARLKGQVEPSVDLRIGRHPTFTRLAFDWNVNFDTAFVREGDMVKVSFNHEAPLDLAQLRSHLPPGVVDATGFTDEGKLKFLLRVEPDVDIRAFREEDAYVVDVTPRNMPTDPVNAAIDDALKAQDDMPDGVREVVTAPGSIQSASNPAPAPAAEAPASEPPAAAADARVDAAPASLAEEANAVAEAPVADTPPSAVAAAPVAPMPVAKPTAETEAVDVPASDQQVADAPPPVEPVPAPQASGSQQQDVAPTEVPDPTTAAAAAPQDETEPAANTATAPEPAEAPAVAVAPTQAPDDGMREARTAVSDTAGAVPDAIDLRQFDETKAAALPPEPLSPEATPVGYDDEARRFVAAEARRIGDIVRVVFPFSEPVPSSVFRRHGSLWMVFDTADPIDVRGMRSVLAGDVEAVEVQSEDGWQAIRVDMERQKLATVGVDGSSWVLTIGNTILEPSRPLSLERTVRGDGGTVISIPFRAPGEIHAIRDPFVGDVITTVTGLGPARGILKPQAFAEFETLMSAHGVAVIAKADDLTVDVNGDTVILERPRGLAISHGDLAKGSRVLKPVADPTAPGHIDLGNLTTSDTEDFLRKIKEQEFAIANTPLEQRRVPRMALSRFYLAHGFAHEALGLMRLAAEDEPGLARDPSFNLLMGAAQALASRPREADDYLERPGLANNPDAAVWRTITSAAQGNWTDARMAMSRGRAVVGNYPTLVQTEFNLAAARTMVEVNDYGQAAAVLSEIDPSLATGKQAARYDIIRGQIADASGRSREALTAFDLVERSEERPLAAEATYRGLRIRHRDGDITTTETVEKLSGLAASWRGDETELKTLRFLAQLHVQNGEYRKAFEAMQSAVQADSDADTTRLLQDEMEAVFASLFLDGDVDSMSPIKALALFYDFREMTPVGRRGDEMVRRLANRLVAMDLLDQASELLRHQIDNRLKGAARSQIAADLGVVYLMDRKPEEALRVLNKTRQAKLPRELERQRNMVEARALTESGRPDLALEIVRNMRGEDVERLRADTLWAAQSWREAGEQLEGIVGGRWSDAIPLADQERADILKAAIGYSLADDSFSLSRLKAKFAAKMSDSPEADAFRVVTRPAEERGVEFMSVLDSLESVDSLDIFLTEYQRKYLQPNTSTMPAVAPAPAVEPADDRTAQSGSGQSPPPAQGGRAG